MNKYKFIIKESTKHLLRSGFFLNRHLKEIDRLNSLSENEYFEYLNFKFLEIFNLAITKSKFYKELYASYGITKSSIKSINDISKLPKISREDIQNCSRDLLTTTGKAGIFHGYTSGSTGTPLHVMYNLDALRRYFAYVIHHRMKLGFSNGDKLVSIRGRLGQDQFNIYTRISNTLHITSYSINENNVLKYYKLISKFEPKAIEGYPSSIYSLCLFLKEKELNLNIPLCFTSSETLLEYQKNLIEEVLNTRVNDLYGNAERIINLSQLPDTNYYYEPRGYAYTELDSFMPICTTLINKTYPLIRYQVNDILGVLSENEVNSLNFKPFEKPIVKRIDGRIEDIVIAKDGSRIGRLNFLFKDEGIKFAQIIQEIPGTITINIVPSQKFSNKTFDSIQQKIDYYFGKYNIECKYKTISFQDLQFSKSNKFSVVISHVT